MNKMLLLVAGLCLTVFSACSSGFKDVSLEGALSQSSLIVFVADASDEGQVETFKTLVEKFPEFGMWKTGIIGYDELVKGKEGMSYDELVKPILEGSFRFGFGVSLKDGVPKELNSVEQEDADFYFIVQSSEADKFQKLMEYFLNEELGAVLKIEENDGVKYWTEESSDLYILRYDDLFVASQTKESLDKALGRMKMGTGFSANEDFAAYKKDAGKNLGYLFVDEFFITEFLSAAYSDGMGVSGDEVAAGFEGLGNSFITFGVDEGGFISKTITEITKTDKATLNKLGISQDGEVHLANKVNADGVIAYAEGSHLGSQFRSIFDSFPAYNVEIADDGVKKERTENIFDIFVGKIATLSGLDVSDVNDLLDSSMAFTLADFGGYYPAISLYLELGDSRKKDAKVISAALNDYVNELLKELEVLAKEEGTDLSFISSDVEVISGGGVTKVSVDFAKLPEELLGSDFFQYIDLTDFKMELYYGVTGDNMLVFALYPGFAEIYGKNVLANDEIFKEATAKVGVKGAYSVSYFRFEGLVNIIERIVELGAKTEGGNNEVFMMYNLFSGKLFAFLDTFKYIVSSSVYKDGQMKALEYVKVEKVK